MRPADLAIALAVITVWGMNFVVVKVGLEQIPPFLFMLLRFAVVAAILVPFTRFPKSRWKGLLGYALMLGAVHFGFMFTAIQYVDASTVALLSQLNTPFGVIAAAIVFKDYPGWRRILGIAIAFIGCAVIAGEPRFEGGLWPLAMVVLGTLAWGIANVQAKLLGEIDPFALNGWMAVFALPPLLAMTLAFESDQIAVVAAMDLTGWSAIFYQSVMVVIFGYGLWYTLLKKYPISRVIPITLLLPVIGVAGGMIFLGETLTPYMIIGGLFVIVGVSIVVIRQAAVEESR